MEKDVNEIIRFIAGREGISEQEVLEEMQKAINAAFKNENPDVRREWENMPFKDTPAPQEFIKYIAEKLKKQRA